MLFDKRNVRKAALAAFFVAVGSLLVFLSLSCSPATSPESGGKHVGLEVEDTINHIRQKQENARKGAVNIATDFSELTCHDSLTADYSLAVEGFDVVVSCSTTAFKAGWQISVKYDSSIVRCTGYQLERDSVYVTNSFLTLDLPESDSLYTSYAIMQMFSAGLFGVSPGEYPVFRLIFERVGPGEANVDFATFSVNATHGSCGCLYSYIGAWSTVPIPGHPSHRELTLSGNPQVLDDDWEPDPDPTPEPPVPGDPYYDLLMPSQMNGSPFIMSLDTNAAITTIRVTVEYDGTRNWFTGIGAGVAVNDWDMYVITDVPGPQSTPGTDSKIQVILFGVNKWITGYNDILNLGFVGWGPLGFDANCSRTRVTEFTVGQSFCPPDIEFGSHPRRTRVPQQELAP